MKENLREIYVSNKGIKAVAGKSKRACRTRWLSLDNSVSMVYEDIVPLLETVNFNTDPIATGFLKR